MAGRIRSIKPELLEDSKAGQLSDGAWRLWVSSWLLADDYGNFRAHPAQLAGQVFWGSPRTSASVGEILRELASVGLLALYQVNGQEFAHITGWTKHQRVDNAGKPRCPKPEEGTPVRGESPRVSASLGDLPPDLRPPISDHRSSDAELAAEERREDPPGGSKRQRTKIRSANALPFTIAQLVSAVAEGAGDRFHADTWDDGLAKPLTGLIRQLGDKGIGLDDVRAAGRVIREWKLTEPIGVAWLAKPGKLIDAIGKSRNGARTAPRSNAAILDQLIAQERP